MFKKILFCTLLIALVILSCTNIASGLFWDITRNRTNTLTKESMRLLDTIDDKMTITVYCTDANIINICDVILAMYKKYTAKISIEFTKNIPGNNIDNKLKLYTDNNIIITYKGAQQAFDIGTDELSEQKINTMIQRVMHNSDYWITFLSGHNEADPLDTTELGLSEFAQLFSKQGTHIATINLAQQPFIPQNTSLLIIANPQHDLLPIEQMLIHKYIKDGGHLLWFTEPDTRISAIITEEFGIKPAKGVVVDPDSMGLGSPHPAIKILTKYTTHPITLDISSATIMPWSTHLRILYPTNAWQQNVCLTTSPKTWTYNGPITNDLNMLAKYKEFTGPLNLAIALSKQHPDTKQEQRALIMADSSFFLNKYLHKYANKQLAANMVSWTQTKANMITYSTEPIKDLSYCPSKFDRSMYSYVFTIFMPLCWICIGLYQSKRKTG